MPHMKLKAMCSEDFPMCDKKFDLNEVDHSRFVKPVSDEELKSLVENQENVNTKNNTKH
jgi:hypothetical protein